MSKKEKKGYYGYVKREKLIRFLQTFVMFLIPLLLFLGAYLTTKTSKNIFSVIAIVGCLPGCKSMVGLIMMLMLKPMAASDHKSITEHKGRVLVGYELYLTSYEHSEFVCAAAVHGNQIICYSDRLKNPPELLEEHITNLMNQNGFKLKVKVFKKLSQFTDRLDTMNAHFEELNVEGFIPDSKYPEYDRDQMIMHILYRLAL